MQMESDLPTKTPLTTFVSWAAFFLSVACLAWMAWYIPADRPRFETILRDFGTKVPRSTEFMLSIPDIAFPVAAGFIVIVSFAVQCFVRAKGGCALLHMFVIMICCVAFTLYRESLFQPLSSLIQNISGSPIGR